MGYEAPLVWACCGKEWDPEPDCGAKRPILSICSQASLGEVGRAAEGPKLELRPCATLVCVGVVRALRSPGCCDNCFPERRNLRERLGKIAKDTRKELLQLRRRVEKRLTGTEDAVSARPQTRPPWVAHVDELKYKLRSTQHEM